MSTAAYWVWFGVAWIFLLAVFFSHWFARERRDQAETDRQLARTKTYAGTDHWQDA